MELREAARSCSRLARVLSAPRSSPEGEGFWAAEGEVTLRFYSSAPLAAVNTGCARLTEWRPRRRRGGCKRHAATRLEGELWRVAACGRNIDARMLADASILLPRQYPQRRGRLARVRVLRNTVPSP